MHDAVQWSRKNGRCCSLGAGYEADAEQAVKTPCCTTLQLHWLHSPPLSTGRASVRGPKTARHIGSLLCKSSYIRQCVCMCVCMCVRMCVSVHVCVQVYVHVCVHVHVCTGRYSATTAHLGALHSLLALGVQPLVPQAAAILVWVAALPQHLCQVATPAFHLRPSCLGFPCCTSPYTPHFIAASLFDCLIAA